MGISEKYNRKTAVINRSRFSDLQGFYEEVSQVFMKDADWKIGTLDGFDDILYGGFGVFDSTDEIEVTWEDSQKSREDLGLNSTKEFYENKIRQGKPFNVTLAQQKLNELNNGDGQTLFEILIEIIQSHKNIILVLG